MTKKRDRLRIMYDILIVIKEQNGKIRYTNILYKSNLSNFMLKEYINDFKKKGFITETVSGGRKTYSIENQGIEFLERYKSIIDFMEAFGLE